MTLGPLTIEFSVCEPFKISVELLRTVILEPRQEQFGFVHSFNRLSTKIFSFFHACVIMTAIKSLIYLCEVDLGFSDLGSKIAQREQPSRDHPSTPPLPTPQVILPRLTWIICLRKQKLAAFKCEIAFSIQFWVSKGSTNWVWIPLFSHNIISRGGARFITVVSMIIQRSHLPYLREHTQHGLDQVCHPLNALAMMTVKINEQIGTLKRSLISWGQMFLACTWTISRHMGSSRSNGSTSVSASLPQLYPPPSANGPSG